MPAWLFPAMMTGFSALGGLFGGRSRKQTQHQISSSQTDTNYTNQFNNFSTYANRTDYDPLLYAYRNKMLDTGMNLFDRLNLPSTQDYVNAVLQQNVAGINKKAELQNRLLQNALAQRGLSGSPMATFARQAEADRIAELIQNSNLRPILERQTDIENMQLEDARKALGMQIFSSVPKDTSGESWQGGTSWGGSTTKTTSESFGENVIPGSALSGLFGSLGSILAFLAGLGYFRGGQSQNGRII
ncbi:MAG: hypothetical protein ACUVQP_00140 [Bacteroidales bacterium]